MATSGYLSTSNAYVKFYAVVTQNSQSVSGNSSSVNVDIYAIRTNSGYTTYGAGTCTLTVNGTSYNSSGTYTITSSATRIGGVANLTVPHNSDGTKTLILSAALNIPSVLSSSVQNYSVVLTTIPRASRPTINTISGGSTTNITSSYMGTSLRIYTHRRDGSFRHKITVVYGGTTLTLCNYTDAMGNLGDVDYTFPIATFASYIPSASSGTCTVYLETFSGSTSVGKYGCSFNLLLPNSVQPSIGSLSTAIVHNTSPSAWGIMIKGKSSLKVTINSPAPSTGASITQYYITGGGYSGYTNPYTGGVINNVGILGYSAVITDSRGRTASAPISSPYIYDYYNPYVSNVNVFRCLANGTANDDGTYLSIKATANYATCNGKNSMILQYRTRQAGGTWSTYTSLTSNTAVVVGAGAITTDKSYEVDVRIADYFTESTSTTVIPTGYVTMDFKKGGKGVSFGKVAESDNLLDVAWDTKITGDLNVIGSIAKNGVEVALTNNTLPLTGGSIKGTVGIGSPATSTDSSFLRFSDASGNLQANFTYGNASEFLKLHGYSTTGTWATSFSFLRSGVLNASGGLTVGGTNVVGFGSNTNGSYIRLYDGTQICWCTWTVTDQTIASAYNSLFTGTKSWTFPSAFTGKPVVTCSEFHWGTSASWGSVSASSATSCTLRGIDVTARAVGTYCEISASALGRWK